MLAGGSALNYFLHHVHALSRKKLDNLVTVDGLVHVFVKHTVLLQRVDAAVTCFNGQELQRHGVEIIANTTKSVVSSSNSLPLKTRRSDHSTCLTTDSTVSLDLVLIDTVLSSSLVTNIGHYRISVLRDVVTAARDCVYVFTWSIND